ncbi:hypothetical protein M0411_18610 [Xanthomonas hortorum pv. vitians]|uniref:hypothetical protein n=1 Tax=Xanthomonas hortorum TaxID=56454 RepID=UPI001652E740|nr:hypothetical protein [Xanthomonas hortorum]MCE4351904.1 hypothetical protein [Xanthomonas hortorum pv. cynarae]MDA4141056.1 hypothetical protein [Xanthomonas hortorum pv. vitians]QNM62512.1 conserved exported hypothetical protein [Xanthomonas hortorum pv. vitians]
MKNLLLAAATAIGLSLSATAFAKIATLSFYGNNTPNPADFVQGCNVSADTVAISYENRVVTVSDGLWDNGAACGTTYQMRCLSNPGTNRCTRNVITVLVVGRCPGGACLVNGQKVTMKIAAQSFNLLVRSRVPYINVEYVN